MEEASLDLGAIAVANRLQEQIAKWPILEGQLPENIEHLAAKRLSFLVELLQEAVIDFTFPRVLGDQVPEMADLGLTDAVNPAETLLQAVGVPGKVVVDHQVSTLEVDPFAGGVGGNEDLHLLVVRERFLGFPSLLAAHSAVNRDDGLGTADEGSNPARPGSSECRGAR